MTVIPQWESLTKLQTELQRRCNNSQKKSRNLVISATWGAGGECSSEQRSSDQLKDCQEPSVHGLNQSSVKVTYFLKQMFYLSPPLHSYYSESE